MLLNIEGSFVDCTIEDSKLQKEGQEERESRSLKGLYLSSNTAFPGPDTLDQGDPGITLFTDFLFLSSPVDAQDMDWF